MSSRAQPRDLHVLRADFSTPPVGRNDNQAAGLNDKTAAVLL